MWVPPVAERICAPWASALLALHSILRLVLLPDRTDQVGRFKSAGWEVIEIDGHNPDEIDTALTAAR